MEYLPLSNKVQEGDFVAPPISAEGKHVVVIGGGDTGADCVGTAHRQGALSVTQLEIMPRPSDERPAHQPWPTMPMIYKVTSAHEEGGERVYAVNTVRFTGDEDGRSASCTWSRWPSRTASSCRMQGTERDIPAELVTLAMGFTGTDQSNGLIDQLGLELDARGNIARDASYATNVDGVFVAGDAGRGQSLIVWAIAEGRSAAKSVDAYLTGAAVRPARPDPPHRPAAHRVTARETSRPTVCGTQQHPQRLPFPDQGGERCAMCAVPRSEPSGWKRRSRRRGGWLATEGSGPSG